MDNDLAYLYGFIRSIAVRDAAGNFNIICSNIDIIHSINQKIFNGNLLVDQPSVPILISSSRILDLFQVETYTEFLNIADYNANRHCMRARLEASGIVVPETPRVILRYVLGDPEEVDLVGVNALDFIANVYNVADSDVFDRMGIEQYSKMLYSIKLNTSVTNCILKYVQTIPDAPALEKTFATDAGYDLSIVKLVNRIGNVYFYDTGIAVEPSVGYHCEIVGRSSIAKTGYTLANSIGIIDSSYRGSIIVALLKHDPDALDLELPKRIVQLIPRRTEYAIPIKVTELHPTFRSNGGFGSTGI